MAIDLERSFRPINIAVMTVSDTRTADDDTSGDILVERIKSAGHHLVVRTIVRDDAGLIANALSSWIDDQSIDAVVTTGGTGLTGRDVTPEARARHSRLRRNVPLAQLQDHRHQHDPVPRLRHRDARHLYLRPAWIERRGEGWVGRYSCRAIGQPQPPVQFRGTDAEASGSLDWRSVHPIA